MSGAGFEHFVRFLEGVPYTQGMQSVTKFLLAQDNKPKFLSHLFENAGHTIHRSSEGEFLEVLLRFLSGELADERTEQEEVTKVESPQAVKISFDKSTIEGEALGFSTLGTQFDEQVGAQGMLPRGSALATPSGDLAAKGITSIIHAASGAMTASGGAFEPTVESVKQSVKNSLLLAKMLSHERVAIPFIGGAIFADRIGVDPGDIANAIFEGVTEELAGTESRLEVVFALFDDRSLATFQALIDSYGAETPEAERGFDLSAVTAVQGDITDFRLHGASAIVNAANMEVQFGGGVSGAIGSASGQAAAIDAEARKLIDSFNEGILGEGGSEE